MLGDKGNNRESSQEVMESWCRGAVVMMVVLRSSWILAVCEVRAHKFVDEMDVDRERKREGWIPRFLDRAA